jgi:hypothetical protein
LNGKKPQRKNKRLHVNTMLCGRAFAMEKISRRQKDVFLPGRPRHSQSGMRTEGGRGKSQHQQKMNTPRNCTIENCTIETCKKVERWIAAKKDVAELKSRLNSAQCELDNSVNDLGKYLIPESTIPKSVGGSFDWFNIWWGNGILRARKTDGHFDTFEVEWLKEPMGKQPEDQGV